MPTPFETQSDWAARTAGPRRSIFGNYAPAESDAKVGCAVGNAPQMRAFSGAAPNLETLQVSIDHAVARAFVYQFLARAFEGPVRESWVWLTQASTQTAVRDAIASFTGPSDRLDRYAQSLLASLRLDLFETFQTAFVMAFGHAARGACPLNEIEYGDLNADALFQPHRLADLAAFYRAFGLEIGDEAAERPDHIGAELEFMAVLSAKDAYFLEHQSDEAERELCHHAQKKFLREHLGRWAPAFARRLARATSDQTLSALAQFTSEFISSECARLGVAAGSEELSLRPVDEAAESLCASCGLQNLPPGVHKTE